MGQALLAGLIDQGIAREQLRVVEPHETARRVCAEILGQERILSRIEDLQTGGPGLVVLAVKPQNLDEVLPQLAPRLATDVTVVSICAGVTTARLEAALGDRPVVRAMPNTPALVRAGVTALAAGRYAASEDLAAARRIFTAVGEVVELEESLMNAVTAISGSGPAYFFRFMHELVAAGVSFGLPPETALALVTATARGAAELARDEGETDFTRLIAAVTSKGGTTEAALGVLDERRWNEAVRAAVAAAVARAEELGRRS